MKNAFYRDFYDKALIPAGANDRKAFLELQQDMLPGHLLIGLQGQKATGKEYYHWNVLVYQTDSAGFADGAPPVYTSSSYDRFDDAVEAARKLENEVRNDLLHAVLLQEKIS
ncbi:hypothetical protein [Bacillus sp. REN3]|uniref:hypothetical protein n=1 Tax=Bacillus sp. REN3 TaxID=2802440 RepID=UPI001AEEA2B2|nr:hypothetical protein [Bacillus sp. REN3]